MRHIIVVGILLMIIFSATTIYATTDQSMIGILSISKLSTSAIQYQTNCYFPIQISLNITWSGTTSIYRINTNNFWLLISTPNIQVTNSSESSYKNPNNLIHSFNIFPNIPVNLILGFSPTCLPSVGIARLLYLDNRFNYTFKLP